MQHHPVRCSMTGHTHTCLYVRHIPNNDKSEWRGISEATKRVMTETIAHLAPVTNKRVTSNSYDAHLHRRCHMQKTVNSVKKFTPSKISKTQVWETKCTLTQRPKLASSHVALRSVHCLPFPINQIFTLQKNCCCAHKQELCRAPNFYPCLLLLPYLRTYVPKTGRTRPLGEKKRTHKKILY